MISLVNIIGVLLLVLSVYLFRLGLKHEGVSGSGQYINNIKIIGGSILLCILGAGLSFSSKSMCEIFGVLCWL